MSQHPAWSNRPARIFTFRSRHSAFIELSLSRQGSQWFLTYPRAYGMVSYTGQRIHSRLNVAASDIAERPRCFWFNSHWLQEDTTAHPLNILLESNPPAIRPTGRTRLEKRQGIVGREEIECAEMEVLVPEDGLLRQCYYCLEWEQDNVPRFGKCGWGNDVYWCSSCQVKGQLISSSWGGLRELLGFNIVRDSSGSLARKDSLYTAA